MLKRWRNLPRAGVGLLGLVLVFTFTLTADATSGRDGARSSKQSTMMFGVPEGVDPATSSPAITTPPVVQEFSIAGAGNVTFVAPASVCLGVGLGCYPGDKCQCVVTTGNVTDGAGPIYFGTFTFWLNIDTENPAFTTPPDNRQYPNGNTVGNDCFFATGVLAVSPAPTATINFNTSGAACNGIGGGVALYSGGFAIGTSTAGFSSAVGGGMIGFGANFTTAIGTFDLKGAGANLN